MEKVLSGAAVWLFAVQVAMSQNWVLTNAGSNDWVCVASSANGRKLIAGQYGEPVAVSTNGGVTWTKALTNGFWNSVASSADGTKLLAASSGPPVGIYLSTNSGASWVSNSLPAFYWNSVAMSADGNTIAAVAPIVSTSSFTVINAVFCSTNAGVSWVSNNFVNGSSVGNTLGAISVAMSAGGSKIFVVAPPIVSRSTNFGASWMQMTNAPPSRSWAGLSQVIASSADGNKLVTSVTGNNSSASIYTSDDSGQTWNLTPAPTNNWTVVGSSADGTILVAAGFPDTLCISTNSGVSWTSDTTENWVGVACSADGGVLVAAAESDTNFDANSGGIYKCQSIQPPLISTAPIDGQLQLSWLIPSTNFVLEESPDLFSWTTVTNQPVWNLANLEDQVVVPATNGSGFYRLATP